MLHTLLFDSLIAGLRGSTVVMPSTLKLYRYAPGLGDAVPSHTPSAFFVNGICEAPGMSPPESLTACAFGARIRKITFLSAVTSGETTTGPCGPRPPRPGCAGVGAGACA